MPRWLKRSVDEAECREINMTVRQTVDAAVRALSMKFDNWDRDDYRLMPPGDRHRTLSFAVRLSNWSVPGAIRRSGPRVRADSAVDLQLDREGRQIVAFRQRTMLPLDDVMDCLHDDIPKLTRSSLRRCLERHGISRLPAT